MENAFVEVVTFDEDSELITGEIKSFWRDIVVLGHVLKIKSVGRKKMVFNTIELAEGINLNIELNNVPWGPYFECKVNIYGNKHSHYVMLSEKYIDTCIMGSIISEKQKYTDRMFVLDGIVKEQRPNGFSKADRIATKIFQ